MFDITVLNAIVFLAILGMLYLSAWAAMTNYQEKNFPWAVLFAVLGLIGFFFIVNRVV